MSALQRQDPAPLLSVESARFRRNSEGKSEAGVEGAGAGQLRGEVQRIEPVVTVGQVQCSGNLGRRIKEDIEETCAVGWITPRISWAGQQAPRRRGEMKSHKKNA